MCTVTYIPQEKGFILTSNRDERTDRLTSGHIVNSEIDGTQIYFPQDMQAGGTWIAAAENGYSLCLLNGAFQPYKSNGVSKKSRGLMLLDFFGYGADVGLNSDPSHFTRHYDFRGIEPFTLLFARLHDNKRLLCELRWDGE